MYILTDTRTVIQEPVCSVIQVPCSGMREKNVVSADIWIIARHVILSGSMLSNAVTKPAGDVRLIKCQPIFYLQYMNSTSIDGISMTALTVGVL